MKKGYYRLGLMVTVSWLACGIARALCEGDNQCEDPNTPPTPCDEWNCVICNYVFTPVCDSDQNGTVDKCYLCDNDNNGKMESCYSCDMDGNGYKDACLNCDSNKDGKPDKCKAGIIRDKNGNEVTDPCEVARHTKNVDGDIGGVMCKDGAVVGACTWPESEPLPGVSDRLKACWLQHENYHANTDPCTFCPPCGWSRQRTSKSVASECAAYNAIETCITSWTKPFTQAEWMTFRMMEGKRINCKALKLWRPITKADCS